MPILSNIIKEFFGILLPRRCPLCGAILSAYENETCLECFASLPLTYDWLRQTNRLTELFAARVPLDCASAFMFYGHGKLSQHGVHSFKYYGNKNLAYLLGSIYGRMLADSGYFKDIDLLVPVPLHRWRLIGRGYNQSEIFCRGMASQMNIEVETNALRRVRYTKKQALSSGRLQRWQNVKDAFELKKPQRLLGRKIMVVDDVITTGATIEACVRAITDKLPHISIGIGCCAVAGRRT